MAIATITQAIRRGDISIYLAANDNAEGSLFGAKLSAPMSPVTIAIVTDALRWGNSGGAQTAVSLREVANYLIWLTGKYGQEAQAISEGSGGGSVIAGGGVQYPFYITSSDFESDGVTYLNSKIAGTNISLFINEYTQQFFPGTEFTYVAAGGFIITAAGFDASTYDYTIRVEKYYPVPS